MKIEAESPEGKVEINQFRKLKKAAGAIRKGNVAPALQAGPAPCPSAAYNLRVNSISFGFRRHVTDYDDGALSPHTQ